MTDRDLVNAYIKEAVTAGALFFNTSKKPYISRYGLYSRSVTLNDMCRDFIRMWTQGQAKNVKSFADGLKPEDVIDTLIIGHGLVVLIKVNTVKEHLDMILPEAEPNVHIMQQQPRPKGYRLPGGQGTNLDYNSVVNLIRSKKLKQDDLLGIVGQDHYKMVKRFPEFEREFEQLSHDPAGASGWTKHTLASSPDEVNKLKSEITNINTFRCYSQIFPPKLSDEQISFAEVSFGLNGDDNIYWFRDLQSRTFIKKKGKELFKNYVRISHRNDDI